jgi:CubicO group peptidase (beta-lactamase class C family)
MRRTTFSAVALLVLVTVSGRTWGQAATPAPAGKIAAALQPFVDNHLLAGAVTLVADKDKILDLEAVGYADIAAGKPMQTDCLFWIASQSKPITAAALMILVDEGKLRIEDPVEKYLGEFRGQMVVAEKDKDHVLLRKPRHPITVRNVLSHTSGLPFKSAIEEPTLDLFPLATRVRSYAMLPLEFEPDTKYSYSNAGINTAGRLIEVASGMPYEKFLDERVFKPLAHRRAAPAAGRGLQARQEWPGSVPHRAAQVSAGRSQPPAHAGRRAVLHRDRSVDLLPHDRQRGGLCRKAGPLRRGRADDDLEADG